jgi:DNA-3-methyladenine glycosylase
LAVAPSFNGMHINAPPFQLKRSVQLPRILRGRRIGITKAPERLWRFGMSGSLFLSRAFET